MPYSIGVEIRDVRTWGNPGQTLTHERSEIAGVTTTWNPTVTDRDDDFGRHLLTYTPSVAGRHLWEGETSDGIPVTLDWDVLTVAQADPASALGSNTVTISGPATASGDFRLTQGDVYSIALGNELSWTLTGAIDLTGETVIFYAIDAGISITGTVTGAGTATQVVQAELTSNQSGALPLTTRRYELRATVADVTLATGSLIVVPTEV